VVLEYQQQGHLLSMQMQQHQAALQEGEYHMAAMQQQHCKEQQSEQQQHAEVGYHNHEGSCWLSLAVYSSMRSQCLQYMRPDALWSMSLLYEAELCSSKYLSPLMHQAAMSSTQQAAHCCSGEAAEHQQAALPLSVKCCCSAVSVLLQETSTMQHELNSSQQEVRKTQQLLRQLERQLAKSHKSRKDAASASQQMQVSTLPACPQWCTRLHLCRAVLTVLWWSAALAAQHGAWQMINSSAGCNDFSMSSKDTSATGLIRSKMISMPMPCAMGTLLLKLWLLS